MRGGGEAQALTAAAIATDGRRAPVDAATPRSSCRRMAPLDRAGAGDLTFLATSKYAALFAATRAGVVLVAPALADAPGRAAVRASSWTSPHDAMLAVLPRSTAGAASAPACTRRP